MRPESEAAGVSYTVHLIKGHKYYVSFYGSKIGDSNTACNITFSAFNINLAPAYNVASSISQIYTFNGSTGDYVITAKPGATGTNYSGFYTIFYRSDVYDLTAVAGAGNEPTLAKCEAALQGKSSGSI